MSPSSRPLVPRPRGARRHRRTAAFSLVEIAMALGIVSFALIALIGMLPVGLKSASEAIRTTNEALVAQAVFAEAQLTPYDDLPKLSQGGDRYFTIEARKTDSDDPFAAYRAEIEVTPSWQPTNMSILKEGTDPTKNNGRLTLVKISLKKIAGNESPSSFTTTIADRGF